MNDSLLTRSHVRKFVLSSANELRFKKFTQISEEYYDHLERHLRTYIVEGLRTIPSKGKTIYPNIRSGS